MLFNYYLNKCDCIKSVFRINFFNPSEIWKYILMVYFNFLILMYLRLSYLHSRTWVYLQFHLYHLYMYIIVSHAPRSALVWRHFKNCWCTAPCSLEFRLCHVPWSSPPLSHTLPPHVYLPCTTNTAPTDREAVSITESATVSASGGSIASAGVPTRPARSTLPPALRHTHGT